MTLDFILSLFKNKRDENILFTIKAGPVVHYSNMSARQIAESPKFGAEFQTLIQQWTSVYSILSKVLILIFIELSAILYAFRI